MLADVQMRIAWHQHTPTQGKGTLWFVYGVSYGFANPVLFGFPNPILFDYKRGISDEKYPFVSDIQTFRT